MAGPTAALSPEILMEKSAWLRNVVPGHRPRGRIANFRRVITAVVAYPVRFHRKSWLFSQTSVENTPSRQPPPISSLIRCLDRRDNVAAPWRSLSLWRSKSQGRFSMKLRSIAFLMAAIGIGADLWAISRGYQPVTPAVAALNCVGVGALTAGALWPRRRG